MRSGPETGPGGRRGRFGCGAPSSTSGQGGPEERATTRVQLEMPPQAMERLQRLKDKTEAASYAEVLRNALRLYEALIAEADRGAELSVRSPDGTVTPYKVFV